MLFESFSLGGLTLQNRMVMSPMTRSRAIDNLPNELMATYYGQRSAAGLIVTEGTAPSPNGLGYPRIPGIFNDAQIAGWKKTTEAAHAGGAAIFVQLMHVGRIAHPDNLPAGASIVAPSAVPTTEQIITDTNGMQPIPTAREMSSADVAAAIAEYVHAAKCAIAAGFDGVELHGANGYLLEQFIHPHTNRRTDNYGGSIENRCRFVLEVAGAIADAIGKDKVGIRLSPYGVFNDLPLYDEIDATYSYLAAELGKIGIVYIHIVDHSSWGAPPVTVALKSTIRDTFGGTIILSGGYDKARAEADLASGLGHLVAFGRPFLANPDLVTRFQQDAPLQDPDFQTFYTPGEKGYTDYPVLTVA